MSRSRRRKTAPAWAGRLFLWGGRGLYLGPAFETDLHAHHAVQVCVGLDATFRLRTTLGAPWRRYDAVIVSSDQPHQLDGGGGVLSLLYLDPEATELRSLPQTRAVSTISAPQLDAIRTRVRTCWRAEHGVPEVERACDEIVRILAPPASGVPPIDRRVAHALELLRSASDRRASLADVAGAVALSPGRLVHLFRAHTGLPMRRYLLWLRLADALQELASGGSLTEAAHAVGFADSAHLSRTFRRMLGITPSALLKGSQVVRTNA